MAGSLSEENIRRIYKKYPGYASIDTFVETGTFRAETSLRMSKLFSHCHTIELSEDLYRKALDTLKDTAVICHQGDSVQVMKTLLPTIQQPAVFFLDAHWCKRESARGDVDVPLLEELRLIATRPVHDLVIIDDVRLFALSDGLDWRDITVSNVLRSLSPKVAPWKRFLNLGYVIMEDRMIIPL